jgi:hypothetical protein
MHTLECIPRIDISTPLYRRLLRRAESFEDSAEDVIRRLLDSLDDDENRADAADVDLKPGARFGARATPGSILPEREYWSPMLEIIAEAGGSAPANQVMEAVGDRLRDRLTPGDYEPLRMGEVRWRNRVRFARLRMREQGLLHADSPRGIWEITEAGYTFLDDAKGDSQEKRAR